MKRHELIDAICRLIGHRRRVPHQNTCSKQELREIHTYIAKYSKRALQHGKRAHK